MDRRSFVRAGALSMAAHWPLSRWPVAPFAARPLPSPAQIAWQRDELAMFLHFGVNTFTDREWGDGREDPSIFAPAQLDARQWARAAHAGGFRAMILTAKHHDGFCLWPTRTTRHSVASSPWRAGQGDLVREFVDACRAERLRPGVYLSPWDRNSPVYGDSSRYNDLYCDQLSELLTGYGPLAEVWFDGANGEGPNGKKQVYDWPRVWTLVRRLQPDAVMFSDAGPDVRWCGNETGSAGDPNWSTIDPSAVPYPGASGPGIIDALQHGHANGAVWRPPEVDTSIRPGWFHHPAEDGRVRSVETLVDIYLTSVGRNAKLLLNTPPTRDGVLHDTDVARLAGFHDRRRMLFGEDLFPQLEAGRSVTIGFVRLAEDIANGQSVARYVVEGSDGGEWRVLSRGGTIGHARIDRVAAVDQRPVRRVRVRVEEAVATPGPIEIKLFAPAAG
jgi:alpha-L-fucosidase